MASCKYHPITPSMFTCGHCQDEFCHDCVDHSVGGEARCFNCGHHVSYHVTVDSVEPFWRRIEKAFRYPLNNNAMMMIVGFSVLMTVIASMPLPWLVQLIMTLIIAGATVNYSFMCLTATSEGNMTPPPLAEAWAGSLGVLWKLFLLVLVAGLGIYGLSLISPWIGIMGMLVLYIGIPAVLMGLAHTGSVLEALNPFNFVRIMTRVGMPYAVLVLFLFIMVGSVSVLQNLIGDNLAALSTILETSVGNYYAVVAFHLMGYMLYQYQDQIGFATADDEEALEMAEPVDVILAHVNIRLKEGDYDRCAALLREGLQTHRTDRRLWLRAFDVLYRLERKTDLKVVAEPYLRFAVEQALHDRLLTDFKKIKQRLPDFVPEDPYLRFHLATLAQSQGDAKLAVQLVNGLHKQYPTFEKLVAAYQLMCQALDDLPNMDAQAAKCRSLVAMLQKKFPEQTGETVVPTKAVYEVKEPVSLQAAVVENAPEPEAEKPEMDNRDAPIEFKL